VVAEALASGVPVVATAVGGIAELVADGENGLVVPPGDSEGLARALDRIACDQAFAGRLRRNCLTVTEVPSYGDVARRLIGGMAPSAS
jgi:glycosyltransferase involved in cell wall biosynthesis